MSTTDAPAGRHVERAQNPTLSKNAQILKFFAQQGSGIGRTRLMKLAYLADLEARKYLGRPISEFAYKFHHHGPFDADLYRAIDELCDAGLAEKQEVSSAIMLHDTGQAAPLEFVAEDDAILRWVLQKYLGTDLNDLLEDIVYETEPMQHAERGELVPVEMVDNETSDRLGIDFTQVFKAEREASQGYYQSIDESLNELHPAGHPA